jgi:hypothetical protein
VEGMDALKPIVYQYFANLFTSEVNDLDSAMMDKIQMRVTQGMNERLLAPFSAEEVKKVLLLMVT